VQGVVAPIGYVELLRSPLEMSMSRFGWFAAFVAALVLTLASCETTASERAAPAPAAATAAAAPMLDAAVEKRVMAHAAQRLAYAQIASTHRTVIPAVPARTGVGSSATPASGPVAFSPAACG
jgi:hypothetical protein